jgi:hypothetical protein
MKILLALSLFVLINAQTTPPMPGGRVDIDPNTPVVVEAAHFAYVLISNGIDSVFAHKMGKVIKAQSQVVAGVKYYLTLEVSETNCKKEVTNTDNCAVTVSLTLTINSSLNYTYILINYCFII